MLDLLAGRRFRVASYGVAAGYAGWLLRQFGANVEHETALDPEGIGAFLGEGARFSAAPTLGRTDEETLITDCAVTGESREKMRRLAGDGPVIWITPWGSEGEWSERPWSDLAVQAAGGWMSAVGEPGREPIGPPGSQVQFTAGLYAAIGALAGHAGWASGGRLVEVPMIEAVVATLIYDPVAFQYYGLIRARVGERFSATQPTLATLPCSDGHAGLHCALHGQFVTLCRLIGHPELATDARFRLLADRAANVAELDTYLRPWFAERTRWEAYHELQGQRIPSSGHPDMREVLESPQLAAREAWHEVSTPGGRRYRVPGPPARMQATSGGGTDQERRGDGPWTPGRVRVVDLSMGWAGPMVGYILASLGADVIKVESHTHFDWWRGSRPPGDNTGMGLHERSHVFNAANRGKRGISLNLATPRGRELALRLMAEADLVVENYGAGVMEKLGLSFADITAVNPSAVVIRLPGFGSSGPEGHYLSFGNTIEGMSGLSSLMGYEDGPPMMMSNAFGDPIGGLNGTVAALSGLSAKARDGQGREIECAQLEGFLPLVAEGLIAFQQTGEVPRRHGNQRPGALVSGGFRCAGEDEWAAVEVRDEAAWERLAALIPGTGEAPERLARWAAETAREDVVEACLAAGIAAAPVQNEAEVLGLLPLLETDFWQGQHREPVGFHQYPGLAIRWEGARAVPELAAPMLGEHNHEVLPALGVSREEMEMLEAEGVIGTVPTG